DEFEDYPDLYEKLISGRNRSWMPAIEGLLAGQRDAMVVVGAMHLVGEDGIIEMLRQRGYTVTQQ
ncbi:MAG: TraB/GumN family protein, partial [Thermoanaerobaculales bacterium]|nr:TraB/GumN family protein [Thermoanaerobaculales bacterium]